MSSRAASRRNRRRRGVPLLATFVLAAFVAGACIATEDSTETSSSRTPAPQTTPAPGAGVDPDDLAVPRTEFCDVLDQTGVEEALGGDVTDTGHYGNGDEVEIRPGYVDVVHENGCVFVAGNGGTAKAWVFARPVPHSEASTLVRRERRRRGCTFEAAGGFGTPGLRSVCKVPAKDSGTAVRARLEGLFGDSWVGCEVSAPTAEAPSRKELSRRAERWCVDVVAAIGRPAS